MRWLKEKVTFGVTMPVSFSGYVLRPRKKTLPWDESRYGPCNRNRQTIFMKKAHRGLIDGYKRHQQADKGFYKFILDSGRFKRMQTDFRIRLNPFSSVCIYESVDL